MTDYEELLNSCKEFFRKIHYAQWRLCGGSPHVDREEIAWADSGGMCWLLHADDFENLYKLVKKLEKQI